MKGSELPSEILAYLATGNRRRVAENCFSSESSVSRVLLEHGIEANPHGRPALRPLNRTAAMWMHVEGFNINHISKILPLSESSLWRILRRTRESEPGLHAVGMIVVHPQTGEILVHQEQQSNHFVGKYEGDYSCQLTTRGKKESLPAVLTRLAQREIFATTRVTEVNLGEFLKPMCEEAVVHVMVADILVSLYVFEMTNRGLVTPKESLKVNNIGWRDVDELLSDETIRLRSGAAEMIAYYHDSLPRLQQRQSAGTILSRLNEYVVELHQARI